MSSPSSNSMKDAELARRMFFGGCAALPFLWVVNVLYYRKQVFGEISWLDKPDEQQEQQGAGSSRTNESRDHNEGTANNSDESNDALKCWVKRSFYSSIFVISSLITWILVFQLNKDSFGEKWFVVDVANPTDRTGW